MARISVPRPDHIKLKECDQIILKVTLAPFEE